MVDDIEQVSLLAIRENQVGERPFEQIITYTVALECAANRSR